jgi:hypothetical protein
MAPDDDLPEAPPKLREKLRQLYAIKRDDIALVDEAERLRHHLGSLSTETREMFYGLLHSIAGNDAITHYEVDAYLGQYKDTYWETNRKDVRSWVIRELTEWWVGSGKAVTKTLAHQNPTGKGDSPVIRFLCREYKEVTGLELNASTALTELKKLGY